MLCVLHLALVSHAHTHTHTHMPLDANNKVHVRAQNAVTFDHWDSDSTVNTVSGFSRQACPCHQLAMAAVAVNPPQQSLALSALVNAPPAIPAGQATLQHMATAEGYLRDVEGARMKDPNVTAEDIAAAEVTSAFVTDLLLVAFVMPDGPFSGA